MTPTLVNADEITVLTPATWYVTGANPDRPFMVTVVGYYTAYVSRRGHFMVQRIDPALPFVRC